MKYILRTFAGSFAVFALLFLSQTTDAQVVGDYAGNIISFNGPRVETADFTLRINKLTSDRQANENLSVLRAGGQDKLLSAIQKENGGARFTVKIPLADEERAG